MQGFGCRVQQKLAFGRFGPWPFSAQLEVSGEEPQLYFRFLARGGGAAAARMARRQGRPHQRWHSEAAGDGTHTLECLYTPPSDFYARAGVYALLRDAAGALQAAGATPAEECPLCGQAGCDVYAFLDGDYRPAHDACLNTRLEAPDDDVVLPRRQRGHIATGLVGAVAGAVIGALPIWSLALSRGRIYWALYVFIPILSALLYRALRGRASTNIGGLAVLLSSLAATLALEQVWYWLVITSQLGLNVPIWETMQHYIASHSFGGAVREMLFCLVALMVGFLASVRLLRRYEEESRMVGGVIRGRRFILASAAPIHLPAQGDDDGRPLWDAAHTAERPPSAAAAEAPTGGPPGQ